MAVSPSTAGDGPVQRQWSLSEWFTLRRLQHPEVFKSLAEVPSSLAQPAQRVLPPASPVRSVLFVPAEYRPRKMLAWEYIPERALVFLDRALLYVRAAGPDSDAETLLLDAASWLYARSSLLLLYGLLDIKADCGSQEGRVRLEYNTVVWQALRKPLGDFITAAAAPRVPADTAATNAANAAILKTLPFKFANGLRYYALEPGEQLHAAAFQPVAWERRLLPTQITPNTLLALTSDKAIVIEEERSSLRRRQSAQGEYGWIFTYIPRNRIADVVVTPDGGWAQVSLDLQWGTARESRKLLFETHRAEAWRAKWLELAGPAGR